MPQIGWFEILIIVVLAILIIGPKDFPIMLKKIGNWTGTIKKYFSDFQKEVSDVQSSIDEDNPIKEDFLKPTSNKKKDE